MASGSGCNLWVWLAGGGCGWNVWVWLVGVVVRRYIIRDFLILLTYVSLLLLYRLFFAAASLLFVHLKKCFSLLFRYFFVIYVIIFSCSINTHTGD